MGYYLGSWKIDDYLPIPVTCHRFSSGVQYAPTAISYSIYEDANSTGIDENVDMVPASPFDAITGFYLARRQLTLAAGFEKGKNYTVLIKKTIDSVQMIDTFTFQIEAEVDSNTVSPATVAATVASGGIDSNSFAANAITATSIASGAITAAKFGSGAIVATAIASGAITNAKFASGAIDATAIAANAIADTKIATGAITAAKFAAGAIDAAALAADAGTEIADALLNRDMSTGTDSGTETVRTVRQALRVLRNKWAISGGTLTVRKEDDTTASWTAAVTTAAVNPVTAVDPTST